MAEIVITCQVSCRQCDWNTGVSMSVDESNLFTEILRFLGQSWQQHASRGPSGEILVTWKPLNSGES